MNDPQKIPQKPKKKKAKKQVKAPMFQWCFYCKEVQELEGDQCAVCFSYISLEF